MPLARPKSRRLFAVVAAALFSLALAAGCASLETQQRRWIFQPATTTWWAGDGAAQGMTSVWIAFDSTITRSPARLHGLWLAQDRPDAPVLLYLHGARWDVTGSAARVRRMHELGFSVLAIDYRGFGKSTPVLPSEATAFEDARAAWDWLARKHGGVPRYIFGHSLGSAIAIDLAAHEDDEAGVIVEGSFTCIADVFANMRWGWLPLGPLIWQRFDSREKIAHLGSPLLAVHGSADTLIPPALGHALFERAAGPKRWLLVEGGSHHSTNQLGEAGYRTALHELFGLQPPAPEQVAATVAKQGSEL